MINTKLVVDETDAYYPFSLYIFVVQKRVFLWTEMVHAAAVVYNPMVGLGLLVQSLVHGRYSSSCLSPFNLFQRL